MADTIKQSSEVKIEVMFVDGDTRTFNVPNPRSTVSQSDISTLNTWMTENNILIGDKYGGRFARITLASKVNKRTNYLDIGQE